MRDPKSTVGKLIDYSKVSFISFLDEEGFPQMRAMLSPRKREGIKTIYLTTNLSSLHSHSYLKDPRACLYFYDKRFFRGVCLKGKIEVLTDEASRELVWQNGDILYYPLGVKDPDYCVLRFSAQEGRYYSDFKSSDFAIE